MSVKKILILATLLSLYTACSSSYKKSAQTSERMQSESSTTQYDTPQTVKTMNSSTSRDKVSEVKVGRVEKDNTALNRNQELTAQTQSRGTRSDVEVTRLLRKRIMADDQLSTNAHNIKIITLKNSIILKGPVANLEEKTKIENFARSMNATKKIDNQLTY
ncbi:MAG: BON domain-containing protein [Bacteriovorax sp.]|nr:BON domain-containing protein [Bacteriovorax sp.]